MDVATLTEFLPALALAIALAASAGLRAWLPLLLASGLARLGVLDLGPSFQFLTSNKALVLFGVATAIELIGDKIPAVDHALDVIGTPLRPAAGALLAASVLGTVTDPLTSVVLGTAVGAPSALVPHAAKSAVRAASTTLSGGLANPLLSFAEDAISVVLFVLAVLVPLVVVALLGLTLYLASRWLRRRSGAGRVTRQPLAMLALALALGAAPAAAQTPPAQAPPVKPFTLEVQVEVVSVTAVVFDKSGKFVRGLGPKDVELLENGVKQEVSYFREASSLGDPAERVPLSIVLVLDTSGSMKDNMRFLQEAVLNFMYKLEEVDTALVVSFNESIKGSAEFSGDTDRLERFVDGLQAWGGTSLYDALHYALGRIRDQPGRKAIIVFSDGADTTSTMEDRAVVDYARAVEATVYSIGFKGSGMSSSRGFLRKVASETGGQFFAPDKVGELIKVFNEISAELKNHYLLAYTPAREADGSWREISLKVTRPDTEVRVRKGYFSPKPRRRSAD